MKRVLPIALLTLLFPLLVLAQELKKPLSAEDHAQVEELLKAFDPNSYRLQYQYADKTGKIQTQQKGLADLTQRNTKIIRPGAAAATNTNNNIFKQASTNTNNNIFKQASTNTNNNIFKQASTNTNNNIFKQASTNTNNNIFKQAATNTNNNIFKQAELETRAQKLNAILQKYQ
jgi:Mg/Co/Ni transporter MgtE